MGEPTSYGVQVGGELSGLSFQRGAEPTKELDVLQAVPDFGPSSTTGPDTIYFWKDTLPGLPAYGVDTSAQQPGSLFSVD